MKYARTYKDFQIGRVTQRPSRDPWSRFRDPAEDEPAWTSGPAPAGDEPKEGTDQ